METISDMSKAAIQFCLKWRSTEAAHTERYFAGSVNFWRDIFPPTLREDLMGRRAGESLSLEGAEGAAFPPADPGMEFALEAWQVGNLTINGRNSRPRFGRFYPKGLLKGLPQIFSDNMEPFRYTGDDATGPRVDFNHPLAGRDCSFQLKIIDVREKARELGGTCNEWLRMVAEGPGMQARWKDRGTDFFSDEPFARADDTDDRLFYETPRLTTHTDDQAIGHISSLYSALLRPCMRVLDLMSSWRSHVPHSAGAAELVGLGMNDAEMSGNPLLTRSVIHDLNADPRLPFDNGRFDAVLCTVSVEYLTRPFEVFAEVGRVLQPGGLFIVTFSHRWFPPKVIAIWTELHEFERVGLVLEYFLGSGAFEAIETCSMRGWPRPITDRYYPGTKVSDPVYAVWGRRP